MSRGPSKPVDNESMYKILGLERNCSEAEIKKAFKKLAIQHHPDKKGDPEKFKEICKAYEILSDPDKRQTYDQYGEEGLEGAGDGHEPMDIFDMFVGRGRKSRGPAKGDDVVTPVDFTLEHFFNGSTRNFAIERNVICSVCEGKGGPADAMTECKECNGRGVRVTVRRLGPMISQSQSPCATCKQTGKIMPESKKCKSCGGVGVVKERKVREVNLIRGARDGERIVFKGQADETPGQLPGDLVIVCRQKNHPIFKRKDADLFMAKNISLCEALTGFAFYITHLDGQEKYIELSPAEIVKHDDVLAVEGEGMPRNGSLFNRGNLYIKFVIDYPTSLSGDQKKALQKILPNPPRSLARPKDQTSIFTLQRIDPETTSQRRHAADDDDDVHEGHPGVQCQQA